MSEPELDDPIARGLDEFCGGCDCLMNECVCSDFDTLEEKYAD